MSDSVSGRLPPPPLRRSVLAGMQLAVWIACGVAYYLTPRPHRPFADLFWKHTLIAAESGLTCSTLLGALYWGVGLRRRWLLWQGLIIVVGGVAMGLA